MTDDAVIERGRDMVLAVVQGRSKAPQVRCFFHEPTFTASYVVSDAASGRAGIIDSVLDFDPAAGRTSTNAADEFFAYVRDSRLTIDWIFETHVHADHLSAAPYLQDQLGGQLAIGANVAAVQSVFAQVYNEEPGFTADGSQFDRLLADGDRLSVGEIGLLALQVPGHTPADMAYLIGDALFVGDTMFMPDYGSARCDFPGGDARHLYRSVRRLMRLPDETRVFLCHDYKAPGRDAFAWESTIGRQRSDNIHIHDGIEEEAFVTMRAGRDQTLSTPKLMLPAIQVNMRAGRFPDAEANGTSYLKLPLNRF
jgi:glyoxylase-like metal-dependent hydrolase (beta-lactamase superfamily II)